MATSSGDRSKHFPAIEKKYSQKVTHWLKQLKDLESSKYNDQISLLRENHGFSQAHANTLVMFHRGSASTRKFETPAAYFKNLDPATAKTMKSIFSAVTQKYDGLEFVMAWNHPMLRIDKFYIIGLSASKNHITVNPFSDEVIKNASSRLSKFVVNKNTFQVPLDWNVDTALIGFIAKQRLSEQN